MSVDYTMNKSVPLNEVEIKTSLKVVKVDSKTQQEIENGDSIWLKDDYGNCMLCNVHNDYIQEITQYGLNNSTKIRDELVKAFNVKFVTDNEIENLIHESNEKGTNKIELTDELFNEITTKGGYIIEGDNVIVPERDEDDYKPYVIDDPVSNITFVLKSEGNSEHTDDDLPF